MYNQNQEQEQQQQKNSKKNSELNDNSKLYTKLMKVDKILKKKHSMYVLVRT